MIIQIRAYIIENYLKLSHYSINTQIKFKHRIYTSSNQIQAQKIHTKTGEVNTGSCTINVNVGICTEISDSDSLFCNNTKTFI